MLADDAAVERTVYGGQGVLGSLRRRVSLHLSMHLKTDARLRAAE
jgi:hypothetical protein